jgi:hypothetical protein
MDTTPMDIIQTTDITMTNTNINTTNTTMDPRNMGTPIPLLLPTTNHHHNNIPELRLHIPTLPANPHIPARAPSQVHRIRVSNHRLLPMARSLR